MIFTNFSRRCLKKGLVNFSCLKQNRNPSRFFLSENSSGDKLRFFSSDGSRAQAADDLVGWMKDNGAEVNDVAIREDPYGQLGLFATKDFSQGDIVMKMPSRLVLTLDSEPKPKILHSLIDSTPPQLSDFKLGLKLLSEKYKKDSFWDPYIRSLPDHFLSTLTFSEEALDVLNYPPLIVQAGLHQKFMEDFINETLPNALKDFPEEEHPFFGHSVDLTALKWSTLAVSSRAFGFNLQNKALLPLMDMANHSFKPSVRSKKFKSAGDDPSVYEVGLIASNDIVAGQPLEINYGNLSNNDFAFLYGFFVKENPYDKIEFGRDTGFFDTVVYKIAGVYEKEDSNRAKEIIQKFELDNPDKGPMLTVHSNGVTDGALLGATRLMLCKDYESVKNLSVEELSAWKCPSEVDMIANNMAHIHIYSMLKSILQNLISHKQFMSALFEAQHLKEDTKLAVDVFNSKLDLLDQAMNAIQLETGFDLNKLIAF